VHWVGLGYMAKKRVVVKKRIRKAAAKAPKIATAAAWDIFWEGKVLTAPEAERAFKALKQKALAANQHPFADVDAL
jgi:hypothetical protein